MQQIGRASWTQNALTSAKIHLLIQYSLLELQQYARAWGYSGEQDILIWYRYNVVSDKNVTMSSFHNTDVFTYLIITYIKYSVLTALQILTCLS